MAIARKKSVRTTINIPRELFLKLTDQAARQGCTFHDLMLRGLEQVLIDQQRLVKRVKFPSIWDFHFGLPSTVQYIPTTLLLVP
jgi:hypothetical protein